MNLKNSRFALFCVLFFLGQNTYARKFDYLKLQHAGEIGYYAIGIGKQVSRIYSIEFFWGLVPKEVGGRNIETTAMKNFWKLGDIERWNISGDFYTGLNIYYVRGSRYQTSRDNRYPEGYYRIGALRGQFFVGGDFSHILYDKHHFYMESGMNDIVLINTMNNGNAVEYQNYISLALGYRYDF